MSDIDSDSQKHKQSNKLGIQDHQIENNNIFSFKERSNRGSSSQQQRQEYHRKSENQHNQEDGKQDIQKGEEKQQQKDHKPNKLSQIINDEDQQKQHEEGNNIEQTKVQENINKEEQHKQTVTEVHQEQIHAQNIIQKQEVKKQNKEEVKNQQITQQIKLQKQKESDQKPKDKENQIKEQNSKLQNLQPQEKENKRQQHGQENKQIKQFTQSIQKTQVTQQSTIIQSAEKVQIVETHDQKKLQQKNKEEQIIAKQPDNIVEQKSQQGTKPQEKNVKVQKNQEKAPQITNITSPIKLQINQTKKEQKIQQKVEQPQKVQQTKRSQKVTDQKDKIKQQEQKYKQQLDEDMSALKNTLIKKKRSDKQKQSEKNKLNKSLVPALSSPKQLQFQQTAQVRAMQLNMITKMAQEKKKQNYQRLKQWDKRRAQSLAIHRNMIQILQNQIDKRIKSSIQNLQIYTTFLKQKARQQQKYIAHPVINTKYALQHNTISKNVYINCTVILNALSDQNNARCRKISDFIHLIKNDILRDSVDVHLSQSQRELLKVRQKISNLKAALRKYNAETQQKTSQLSLFFNQNAVNMSIDGQRDFYLTQIQFLQKASQQTSVQKKLGQHCLQYLYTAINQQIKRSKVIRDAMITFTKALQQCYGIQPDAAEIEQLSKAQQNKLIQQFYSLEEIFDQRCLTVYKTHQNMDNSKMLTVDNFAQFLNKFQFEGFDCRVVLLKQYNVRYHPSVKNQTNKQQNCYLVITVDKFIHLFLSKEKTDVYARPDVTIKATMKNLQLKAVKNQILDIVIKDDKRISMISYFWETKNDRVYRIEFPKKDSREEFMDYIRKLRG